MTETDSHIDVIEPPLKEYESLDHSITSKYIKIVEGEDKHIFKSIEQTADKTVVFIGLFSAAVAVLVAVSIQDLSPSSQFYLTHIYELLAEQNGNVSQATSSPRTSPPDFSPPTYAILVNSLWFLSLSTSLICGALATSQQHWIHSYMMVTQAPQIPPRKRARIHAFRYRGIMNSNFFLVFDITSALIHISLFLFFIGLLIYLFNINFTLFCAVVWFLGASAMAYLVVALIPIYRIDSPYSSPLSFLLYWPFSRILYAILHILNSVIPAGHIASEHFHRLKAIYSEGFASAFLRSALKPSLDIECQIMDRTIDGMDDPELEWAFERFCDLSSSSVFGDTQRPLAKIHEPKWSSALEAFSARTLSSDSLSESDKIRRLGLCMKVADLARLPNAGLHILHQIFDRQHPSPVLQSIKMGNILRRWNRDNQEIGFCTKILVSGIIANIRSRNDDWIALAEDQLGKEVRDYRGGGDGNVLLANFIHITCQILYTWGDIRDGDHDALTYILRSLSNFDIQSTPPVLRQNFLDLWGEINRRDNAILLEICRDLHKVLTRRSDNDPVVASNPPGDAGSTGLNEQAHEDPSHTNPPDSTSSQGTSPANPSHSTSLVPEHPTAPPVNGGGAPDRSLNQHTAPSTMPPQSSPSPLERHGVTPGNIADTSSLDHPGSGTESSPASLFVPLSVRSSATSPVASVSDPNGAGIAPLSMRHEPTT